MGTEENKWCVYIHRNVINEKAYIGITKSNPKIRWGNNGRGYGKAQVAFYGAIQKYGWDNFEHIIWAENLTEKEAKDWEIRLIAIFKTNCCKYKDMAYGYNMTDGGDGVSGPFSEEHKRKIGEANKGKIRSEETRKKIGDAHRDPSEETRRKMRENHPDMFGKNNPNFGRHHTEEEKKRISEKNKGKVPYMKGKHHTENSKKKISESKKGKCSGKNNPNYGNHKLKGKYVGKNHPNYGTGNAVVQLTLDNKFITEYVSAYEAGVITGINRGGITQVCNHINNRTIAGGFHWMYKEEYLNTIQN